jgi:hypothetical protein
MRPKSLFLAFIIVLLCPCANAQWVQTDVPDSGLGGTGVFFLAATRNAVFAETGGGAFSSFQDSMNSTLIPSIAELLAATDSVVYAFNDSDRVCYSTDEGNTWKTPSNVGVPTDVFLKPFAVAGTNFYLGGAGACGLCDQGGVYLSTNSGASWAQRGLSNIYLLATRGTNVYAVGFNGFCFSKDTASTWDTLSLLVGGYLPNINAIAFRDSEMYVGYIDFPPTGFSGGVFRSTNGGRQWESISAGLSHDEDWVTSLAVRGEHVFAGTTAGVYILNKDDTSWTTVGTGLPSPPERVDYLAATDSNLYAGLVGGIWKRPISEMVTTVSPPPTGVPTNFVLFQNFPNPFNPNTTIKYALPRVSQVSLTVYDILGRQVSVLVNERKEAGVYEVKYDGSNLASGVYFYRLQAGDFVATKRLLLLN